MSSIVTGQGAVLFNLWRARKDLEKNFENSLYDAGEELLEESQARVPVEFGELKRSGYARAVGNGFNTTVYVGYTAPYAAYVHECVEMKLYGKPRPSGRGVYWDPLGQATAKFLEMPARVLRGVLVEIMIDGMKIKLR